MPFTPRRWTPAGATTASPALRADYDPNYYAGFVVDPDGYRIEAYCGRANP